MQDRFFFGYGSLVNRDTHDFEQAHPARVSGWRRLWRHTSLREVAYLTVVEAPGHSIDGLIAAVPDGDWAALDERERAYTRHEVPDEHISHSHPGAPSVHIYKVPAGSDARPSVRHPILLSYLDTVIKGYLDVFGEIGVTDFFASTDGWDAPIHNDRAAPIYPRHQHLSNDLRDFVDLKLAAVDANVIDNAAYRRW